uniref:Transcriptional regulator, LysR family n=1 Tax=Caulobacter sp. (strain K31) TaxID=366602 RepID=B0T984_CAUSK
MGAERFGEMETFAKVVELGGFSAAAKARRMTPSAVSKLMGRLEARLGARLLNRSTRMLQLTPEGQAFYEACVRVLADLQEAERAAARGAQASGLLRVSVSAGFGLHVLAPLIAAFLARHPGVSIEISYSDAVIDLLAENTDVGIRTGPLKTSSLMARKLGESPWRIVAAPDYLARHGAPPTPDDLSGRTLIGLNYARAMRGWPLREPGRQTSRIFTPSPRAQGSDGEIVRHLALNGVGLARLPLYAVARDLAEGRLVTVLETYNPGDVDTFYAVFPGGAAAAPARTRAFVDFLVETVRLD